MMLTIVVASSVAHCRRTGPTKATAIDLLLLVL
jgi:hypothetical protein